MPIDQSTGSLKKGFYVIDGTVTYTNEPQFIDKSDLYMSMKHYGLNGAAHNGVAIIGRQQGLAVNLNDIKNIFGGGWAPSCIGGTYNMSHFNQSASAIIPVFDQMFANVNQSVASGNGLIENINKLFKLSSQLWYHAAKKASGDWSSKCTKDTLNAYKDFTYYYYRIVYFGFYEWIKYYFDITDKLSMVPSNQHDIPITIDKTTDVTASMYREILTLSPKATTTDVKAFILTSYVLDKNNVANFNLGTFLQGVTTVVASFGKPSGTNPGNNN